MNNQCYLLLMAVIERMEKDNLLLNRESEKDDLLLEVVETAGVLHELKTYLHEHSSAFYSSNPNTH